MSRRPCVYVNTSIVLRALNPLEPGHQEARQFLEECCKRCRCVYSSVHELERMTPIQRLEFDSYLEGIRAVKITLHDDYLDRLLDWALDYIVEHNLSEKRLNDIMHMRVAQRLGCSCILAIDRFIRARSRDFNLGYANHYTGCDPCCPQRSGARTGTGQAYSSASSPGPQEAGSARRPGRSTRGGPTRRSPTERRKRSSKDSQRKPRGKKRIPRRGRGEEARGMTRAVTPLNSLVLRPRHNAPRIPHCLL